MYSGVQSTAGMDSTLSVSEARAKLPSILDQVEAGDEVTITRHGRPIAVVVPPSSLRTRRADAALAVAADIERRLAEARNAPRPAAGLSKRYADELAAAVREGRSRI